MNDKPENWNFFWSIYLTCRVFFRYIEISRFFYFFYCCYVWVFSRKNHLCFKKTHKNKETNIMFKTCDIHLIMTRNISIILLSLRFSKIKNKFQNKLKKHCMILTMINENNNNNVKMIRKNSDTYIICGMNNNFFLSLIHL